MNLQNISNNLKELQLLVRNLEQTIKHLMLQPMSKLYKQETLKCLSNIKKKIYNIEKALQ